jgi:hypothetical protein
MSFGLAINTSESCYLATRTIDWWKVLRESGNESPKAWYIVINSLMRDAQSLPGQGPEPAVPLALNLPSSTVKCSGVSSEKMEISEKLAIMSHAIHCFKLTLPHYLEYHGEYLSFTSLDPNGTVAARHLHSEIYIIYVMEQLAKFMIYHQQAFVGICQGPNQQETFSILPVESDSLTEKARLRQSAKGPDNNALNSYLQAADNILTIINSSAENHVQHVNPLLASTIWLAAAVQVVYKVFGPPEVNRELAESKFDVLRLHHRTYVEFWNTPQVLQENLESLEAQLERLRTPRHPGNTRGHMGGDVTTSNPQTDPVQLRSEVGSIYSQQHARANPNGTTLYKAGTEDPRISNMTSSNETVFETRKDIDQGKISQPQLAIGTWNQSMKDTLDHGSSATPTESGSFEELDYELEWNFGFNDNVPLHLDGLLSGTFV